MSHLDPEQLTLLALGESVASLADCAHLRACEQCAAELDGLQSTVQVARTVAAEDDALEAPPERVWHAIHEELGLRTVSTATIDEPDAAGPTTPESATAAPPVEAPPSPPQAAPTAEPPGEPPAAGRGFRTLWALAAVFVLVAGVGVAGWVVQSFNAPTQIAAAQLAPFPAHPDATGTAGVEEARDGTRTLVVTVGSDTAPDTYREVWLIRNDAGALISLGVLNGDTGSFVIPEGVDLAEYNLVDVSVEPIDGDPAHSGDSIVRGELSPA
ncbi:hypothetical protein GCM10022200_25070 [Microbacterium awajiense]|uniref:Anti-sigma K factor RskA C-terminal domain-containing protein n=1 Tax=Microbacterium awajiense TaxID=415214 RepID=A0ABP7ATP7_9MICO